MINVFKKIWDFAYNEHGNIKKSIGLGLPCGSPSISSTFFPACASPTPKFAQVVVLPTPPFWLAMAIICVFTLQSPRFWNKKRENVT